MTTWCWPARVGSCTAKLSFKHQTPSVARQADDAIGQYMLFLNLSDVPLIHHRSIIACKSTFLSTCTQEALQAKPLVVLMKLDADLHSLSSAPGLRNCILSPRLPRKYLHALHNNTQGNAAGSLCNQETLWYKLLD